MLKTYFVPVKWTDGWIICSLTAFLTALQSYPANGKVTMKGCVQQNPVYHEKSSASRDLKPNCSGNKLEGELGHRVSLQAQTSPNFQMKEKFECIEHTGSCASQLKTSL